MASELAASQIGLPRAVGMQPIAIVHPVGWSEVFERIHSTAPRKLKLYGIPRGGAIVAGLIVAHNADCEIVDSPEECDVIVDDIIDSGNTRQVYAKFGKQHYALIDKQAERLMGKWVVFPWEYIEKDKDSDPHASVTRLLQYIGEDARREGLRETPRRVVNYLLEMTEGYRTNPNDVLRTRFHEKYDEMVIVRDMPFWSLCEHHLLPFNGTCTVGYIPNGEVVGLSKIARLLHVFARRLQVQERMTTQIADAIQENLKPKGVGVLVEASHTCMSMRGVKTPSTMVTSCLYGVLRSDLAAREEFLRLSAKGGH